MGKCRRIEEREREVKDFKDGFFFLWEEFKRLLTFLEWEKHGTMKRLVLFLI